MSDDRVSTRPFCEMARNASRKLVAYQVIGERSSGTNYVSQLLRISLNLSPSDELGWKHGFPHMVSVPSEMLVVCVFRNAPDWLRSMHSKPWQATRAMQRLEFSEFIRAPFETEVGDGGYFNPLKLPDIARRSLQFDRHPLTGETIANVVQLRNLKTLAFLGTRRRAKQYVIVQFETVLADPESFVRQIRDVFGVTGPDNFDVGDKRYGSKFPPAVRVRPATPEILGKDDFDFMYNQLDLKQEAAIGYEYRP